MNLGGRTVLVTGGASELAWRWRNGSCRGQPRAHLRPASGRARRGRARPSGTGRTRGRRRLRGGPSSAGCVGDAGVSRPQRARQQRRHSAVSALVEAEWSGLREEIATNFEAAVHLSTLVIGHLRAAARRRDHERHVRAGVRPHGARANLLRDQGRAPFVHGVAPAPVGGERASRSSRSSLRRSIPTSADRACTRSASTSTSSPITSWAAWRPATSKLPMGSRSRPAGRPATNSTRCRRG